nr:MAG TPA: hypothetical protein [Caudoviricetes sp.]
MGALLVLIIAAAVVYYTKVYNSPNAKAVRAVCQGKTPEQVKTVEYFCKEGCMTKTISDDEYLQMVRAKRDSMNFKKKALDKIGLDEDEVSEIPPAMFEGFVYKNAYAKQNASGKWVSSAYQVSWVFFSSTQVYLYSYTFNMDEDKKNERTDEFFYKDVTSFSTLSESDTAHGLGGNTFEVTSEQFAMVVPGDKLFLAMGDIKDADSIIQAMKQKLREKKM